MEMKDIFHEAHQFIALVLSYYLCCI